MSIPKKTLEDILREKLEEGQDFTKLLKKGTLAIRPGSLVGNEGEEDLEFWEDGAETKHKPLVGESHTREGESEKGGSVRSRRDDDD
ncbi:hypothetical protein LTS15_007099 [Exophiala xenobiotica]|nr:hypothetical protein LTS15_007099 [Exophiala xenobiotica]